MSLAWQLYVSTVLIYAGVDIMACWALNLQLGVSGVLNFAFIVFQAAGAYTAAVPSASNTARKVISRQSISFTEREESGPAFCSSPVVERELTVRPAYQNCMRFTRTAKRQQQD